MKLYRFLLAIAAIAFAATSHSEEIKPYSDFVAQKRLIDGYFPLLLDDTTGKVFVVIPNDRSEFIFQGSLPQGVGSNDVGLDRGQLGDTRLVVFERIGDKVLLRQLNTRFRAVSDNAAERKAVEQAFASSVLWGFKVAFHDDTRTIIDYTPFLLSDVHQVAITLRQTKQGEFRLDDSRSALYSPRTRAFPRNSEMEATLTFTSDKPGSEIRSVAPEPTSISVHVHHSLIALPPAGYDTRQFIPYSGFWSIEYMDYAQPLQSDLIQRVIPRHRLKKKNPTTARSEAVAPLIYYLDPGTPEPIRSALLDGARWWNKGFEAIGYVDAFQVKMLPADVDPMDVRYNVIQWIHRSTRGWSYGSSVIDPRTGEIIKGHVSLGSLRVRQDQLIAQGLLSPFGADENGAATSMALDRLRQLAAHEVGHTLGIAHNFAASIDDRASVMDYPHPRIRLSADGNNIDLRDAYGKGLGPWDMYTIAYGYSEVPQAREKQFLADLVAKAEARGMRYVTDQDSRSVESFNDASAMWDDGTDSLAEFDKLLKIRRIALSRFGTDTIRTGTPWSELAKVVAPIYYMHRYQAEAVSHLVGGVTFTYATKGDTLPAITSTVPAAKQISAIDIMIATLSSEQLNLDPQLIARIAPPAYGFDATRDNPPGRTGGAFDPVTMAEAAGEDVLLHLLAPGRLARLQQQHALNTAIPSNASLFDTLLARTVRKPVHEALAGEIDRRINLLVVEHLLQLGYGAEAVPETQSSARAAVRSLNVWLESQLKVESASTAHYRFLADTIEQAIDDKAFKRRENVAAMPPGAPI